MGTENGFVAKGRKFAEGEHFSEAGFEIRHSGPPKRGHDAHRGGKGDRPIVHHGGGRSHLGRHGKGGSAHHGGEHGGGEHARGGGHHGGKRGGGHGKPQVKAVNVFAGGSASARAH